jgi:hypothetical protein
VFCCPLPDDSNTCPYHTTGVTLLSASSLIKEARDALGKVLCCGSCRHCRRPLTVEYRMFLGLVPSALTYFYFFILSLPLLSFIHFLILSSFNSSGRLPHSLSLYLPFTEPSILPLLLYLHFHPSTCSFSLLLFIRPSFLHFVT